MPMKIISLVPSITELLVDLGLEDQLIAVTKYCVHPKHIRSEKEIIGGTKTLQVDKIKALKADLIIANKEENQKDQIESLLESEPVWLTDIRSVEDNWQFIIEAGNRCHVPEKAEYMVKEGRAQWDLVKDLFKGQSVLYFIWRKPYMTISQNTFIHSVLSEIGFKSVSEHLEGNYPELSPDWISDQNIDYILLSSEPYAFKAKHASEFIELNSNAKVQLIDGEMCSWYGSRMLKAPRYFLELSKKML